jgi:hypothetical protein
MKTRDSGRFTGNDATETRHEAVLFARYRAKNKNSATASLRNRIFYAATPRN